jgi:hypothetical protein
MARQALPNICPAACTARRVLAPVTLVSNFYLMGRLVGLLLNFPGS